MDLMLHRSHSTTHGPHLEVESRQGFMAASHGSSELQAAHIQVDSTLHSPLATVVTHIDSAEAIDATSPPDDNMASSAYSPTDHGRAAWQLLAVAFVYETFLWGFPLSFGVFEAYYSRLPQFQDSRFVGVIGTVASGMSYLAAPIMIPIVNHHARYRRHMIFIGWPICLLGLVAGSFAGSLPTLIFTQGIMYGFGFIIFYYPILSMVNDYWVAKRGMAYGLLCSASGFSGTVMPFAIQALLTRFGYQITLRAIAVGLAIITGPLIPLLRGRKTSRFAQASTRVDWSFVRTTRFWTFSTANLAMSLAYFLPALYLPSYAISNGFSPTQGALLLAIMSFAQFLGQFSFGYLSDRSLPIESLVVTSTLVAAIAAYVCWGLARSLPVMALFAVLWGFNGSGFTALWARIGSAISRDAETAFAAYGTFNVGKGLANICAGLIGSALIEGGVSRDAYGSNRYEKLILFTGTGMLASSLIVLCYGLSQCRTLLVWVR